jgi:TctA family transporter
MNQLVEAVRLVAAPDVMIAILASSIYGLVIGCLPGLAATMATALLVPVTFFMEPVPALGAHTGMILRSLGYAQEEIERLRAEGAV